VTEQGRTTTTTVTEVFGDAGGDCCSSSSGSCCGSQAAASCCTQEKGAFPSQANDIIATAKAFFNDLEYGKGADVIAKYTTDGATFSCMCLPQKTLAEYAEFMKTLGKVTSEPSYEIKFLTSNENTVTIVAEMNAVHTGFIEGFCPQPQSPPKKCTCHYSYTLSFSCCGKIKAMHKVFDIFTAFTAFGWPLPGSA